MEIIEEEQLLDNTIRMGDLLLSGLENIAEESRTMLSNVRGKGLMVAFDLPDQALRDHMLDTMFQNGLLAIKCGDQSIRFRGMLDTPEDAITKSLEIVAQSIPKS
jgi:L-lysine 6-transaminase